MSKKPAQWIVHTPQGWGTRKEGSSRLTEKFDTQAEAINSGRQIAVNQGTELFIQGRNGQIRERNSYGNDPHPPIG